MTTLTVSEVFGPTVQGEGPSAGTRCAFVRLGRCNLDCDWCDTPFTWDWKGKNGVVYDPADLTERDVVDVFNELTEMQPPVRLVVISGGEPMLQRRGLTALVKHIGLLAGYPAIEIETNGTQMPWRDLWCDEHGVRNVSFNVSPKLASSGVSAKDAWNFGALQALLGTGRARFKFVVSDEDDLNDVLALVHDVSIPPEKVWVMGVTPFGQFVREPMSERFVAEWAVERGFNYTGRLHVYLWGQERGR